MLKGVTKNEWDNNDGKCSGKMSDTWNGIKPIKYTRFVHVPNIPKPKDPLEHISRFDLINKLKFLQPIDLIHQL